MDQDKRFMKNVEDSQRKTNKEESGNGTVVELMKSERPPFPRFELEDYITRMPGSPTQNAVIGLLRPIGNKIILFLFYFFICGKITRREENDLKYKGIYVVIIELSTIKMTKWFKYILLLDMKIKYTSAKTDEQLEQILLQVVGWFVCFYLI